MRLRRDTLIAHKKKIVLFLPHRADPTRGEMFSADLLPLELLQIASGPIADGYEVVMIDAMIVVIVAMIVAMIATLATCAPVGKAIASRSIRKRK